MTQEEKFNEAQRLYKTANADQKYVLERLFPELKESGDEMIRKAIRYAIGQSTHSDGTLINGVSSEEALAWLKRQGKQNYVWNEEDEKMLNQIISIIENADDDLIRTENVSIYTNWLKNRLRSQLKWKPSNEQIGCLSDAIKHYNSLGYPASKLKELLDDLNKLIK